MSSGSSRKILFVAIVAMILILWPRSAAGVGTDPEALDITDGGRLGLPIVGDARSRLAEGFRQILGFFAEREFSLLTAWREMRASADPDFFDHKYPGISKELDAWAATLERRYGVSGDEAENLDFTFLLDEFGAIALDPDTPSVTRDNALATICMVCVMDDLRCDPDRFHRFLSAVVTRDAHPARKAEALRWWRRSDGFIDEGMMESVLGSPAGADPDLRAEVAKVLFSISTRRSLQAQRLLASTAGLPDDGSGRQPQIACAAIRHIARARLEEATPDLIAALEDPSGEVRACADESLERLTGRDFGFEASADEAGNAAAVGRWRSWWAGRSSGASGTSR